MEQLLFLLILLACPLAMFFMMRGGHGHTTSRDPNSPETDARVAELEREVARLRAAAGSIPQEAHSPGPTVADRVAATPLGASTRTAPEEVHHG